jgi:hypothetical protein
VKNQTDSPLLRLPGEICNAIYAYAVGGHRIDIDGNEVTMTDSNDRRGGKERFLALGQTCRQTHSESAVIIFTNNDFGRYLDSAGYLCHTFGERFKIDQFNAIQNVWVELCHLRCFKNPRFPLALFPSIQRLTVLIDIVSTEQEKLDEGHNNIENYVRVKTGRNIEVRLEVLPDGDKW